VHFLRIMGTWGCWLAAAGSCAAAGQPVRVCINGHLGRVTALTISAAERSRAVDANGGGVLAEAGAGARWSLSQAGGKERRVRGRLSVGGREQSFEARALRIETGSEDVLRVGVGRAVREYPGVIEIQPGANGWTVINEAPREIYLQGVVAAEVSERWHPEALKALAVAARSYTEHNRGRHGELFDVCDGTHCHCYAGLGKVGPRIRAAVAETAGIVALFEGRPIDAVYSADCGGRTQTVQDAWGSRHDVAYLRSVLDAPAGGGPDYCAINPRHSWSLSLSREELTRLLSTHPEVSVGTLRRLDVVGLTASGRPAALELLGGDCEVFPLTDRLPCDLLEDAGDSAAAARGGRRQAGAMPSVQQVPVSQFRAWLGDTAARGTMIQFEPRADGGLRIEGRGNGHGVGLCQYGAQGMAARYGKSWQEILNHYYTGITFGPVPTVARRIGSAPNRLAGRG
jgi:stage II sporulation protein D (peptidoglycan lytic transglycosylase)